MASRGVPNTPLLMGFESDRNLHFARKRDYLRSKLSVGKRLKAKIEADEIVDKHIALKKKETEANDQKALKTSWDDAMNTTMENMREQGQLNKIVL